MGLNTETVKELVKEYYTLHNYSKHSRINCITVLNGFSQYLINKTKVKDYRDVEVKHYYGYLEYLSEEKRIKLSTVKNYGMVLKKAFSILEEEEKILFNPFYKVASIKVSRNIRDKVLTEDEIKRLFSGTKITNIYGFRNRAILELLYGTGLRRGELINLELTDFLIEERMILVRNGKGKKDRIIPLGDHVYSFIVNYVKKIRSKILKKVKNKYMFVTVKGTKLTFIYFTRIIQKLSRNAGIEKKVSPHVIRHTFATHLLKRGAGIRQIQELLGHKCISSTMVYINLNQGHLKDEYMKYHPLENELYYDVYAMEEKAVKGELKTSHRKVKRKF